MPELQSHLGYYLWQYVPSIAASVIFLLLFLAAAALHFWRQHITRSRFCLAFAIGVLFEFIGYCGRASAYNKTGKLMPYIIQSLFILVAPALFAASIYMTLGRIIRCVKGEHHSVIRVNWLTKLFVCGDILSFVVQGGSAGLMFKASTTQTGEHLVVAGLFIQIISFGLFFVCALIFHSRMNKAPTAESHIRGLPWKQTLYMLYAVSILIFARSIFRVVEYIEGQSGYSLKHEWTMYIFDAIPMLAVTVLFYIWYPSNIQPVQVQYEHADVEMNSEYPKH